MAPKEQAGGPAPEDLTARARIRDAALKHFAEHGFTRATIREIARTADVSPGLVRHHFGSKEALRQACDEYVLAALRRLNDQALTVRDAQGARSTTSSQSSLGPFERYMARALIDSESTVAASLFDEMVTMGEQWLTGADEGRSDPSPVDRRTRAALMTAMALGIPAFHEHLSRVMDVDVLSAEGDRRVALAMLDIYSHSMISPEFADAAKAGLETDPPPQSS